MMVEDPERHCAVLTIDVDVVFISIVDNKGFGLIEGRVGNVYLLDGGHWEAKRYLAARRNALRGCTEVNPAAEL